MLRKYQGNLIDEGYEHLKAGARSVCFQLATGGGKSRIIADIVRRATQKGSNVIAIAHRQELIRQLAHHIGREVSSDLIGIIQGDAPIDYGNTVQVATIQTLSRRELPKANLILWDECHHSEAAEYRALVASTMNAYHLGFTATPCRLDGKGLRGTFEQMVCGPSMRELISLGHLSRYRLYSSATVDDNAGQLNDDYIGNWRQYAGGMRTVTFCRNVDHSKEVAARYCSEGIPAVHIDGGTSEEERRENLLKFLRGDALILCNVGIVGEGFDLSTMAEIEGFKGNFDIGCSQILRETGSVTNWLQWVGRCLRPDDQKEEAIILDHAGNVAIHGFPDDPRVWTLDGVIHRTHAQAEEDERQEAIRFESTEYPCVDGSLVLLHPSDRLWALGDLIAEGIRKSVAVEMWVNKYPDLTLEEIAKANKAFLDYGVKYPYTQWRGLGNVPSSHDDLKAIVKILNRHRPVSVPKAMHWLWASHEWNSLVSKGTVDGVPVQIRQFERRGAPQFAVP